MQRPQFDRSMADLDNASANMQDALAKLRSMGAKKKSPDETHLALPVVKVATNSKPKRDTAWRKIRKLFG